MKPYQPSNKVTNAGFRWLLLSSVVGGTVIGTATYLISRLFYLIVLFPIGMGMLGGGAVALAVHKGKVRNPTIATLFGLLTGLILYGSMYGADYWQFKQTASQEIAKNSSPGDGTQNDRLIDSFLQEQTGSSGFIGYVKYKAQLGVSIGRFGSKGANLGETGTWIYWLIEFAAIEIIIAFLARSAASEAFCESCNEWYKSKERVGDVELQSRENFLSLLQKDQFAPAGQLISAFQNLPVPNLQVHLQSCPACKLSDSLLTVNDASLDNKGNLQEKEAAQGMISPRQLYQLQNAIPQPPPPPAQNEDNAEENVGEQ